MKHVIRSFTSTMIPLLEPLIKFELLAILDLTFRLWMLTLVVPLTLTVLMVFFFTIGALKEFNLDFWRYYYYDGYLCGFIAWRVHLGIMFFCGLFSAGKIYE